MDLHANSGMKKRKPEEQDALTSDHGNSASVGESSGSGDLCKSSTSGSLNSKNPNGSNSDISCQDVDEGMADDDMVEDDDDDADEDPDYGSDFYYNDDDIYENDDYSYMLDQFDSVDLPPGVEASLPWLKGASMPAVAQAEVGSSSKGIADETKDVVMQRFRQFKRFDTIDSFPDHHYAKEDVSESQRPKNWAKRIQEEWKMLEENLPETVFVRACESRMELLRAVIIGPQGTPYHDGLFFFDCLFPSTYPAGPPKVHYHSGGLRLNPNLYNCGKVCLSLLGTWHGRNTENWIPDKSTMLQVLISIQALILNEKPFFNEPGYESSFVGAEGQRRSKEYNDNTFILSLKTMMYTMRKPPKHFEDFVAGHFRIRAYAILTACRSYTEGDPVGSVVHNLLQTSSNARTPKSQTEFQQAVRGMMNTLIAYFTKNGATNCDEFRSPEVYDMSAAASNLTGIYKVESSTTSTKV